MEKTYAVLGIIAVYCLICLLSAAVELAKKKEECTEDEIERRKTCGCFGAITYLWFIAGLLTSQWFLCAVWIAAGVINWNVMKLIGHASTPFTIRASFSYDIFFALFIILNIIWLHIDVYNLFISIF